MRIIDTHSHVFLEDFKEDLDDVISRAREVGVEKVLLPNIDVDTIGQVDQCVSAHPEFFKGMMGLHPCSVKEDYQKDLDVLRAKFETGDYCAVGEIGIDLYWDKSTLPWQEEAFGQQCEWALELDLPIVIHARDSYPELYKVLEKIEFGPRGGRGVFHCFTGTEDDVKKVLSLGDFYLGLGGVVTFKNTHLREVLPHIPTDRLLMETDAPYLSPVPNRGKRNEPANLQYVVATIAETLGMGISDVAEQTSKNADRLFNLKQ